MVSNVISMTVGESAHAELDDETEKLAETISQLKSKLAELSDKP